MQVVERGAGRHQVQVLPRRLDDEVNGPGGTHAELQRRLEEFGRTRRSVVGGLAEEVTARVGLPVQIDDQGTQAPVRGNRRQVAGDGRLADATLLIEYDAPHAGVPRLIQFGHCALHHRFHWGCGDGRGTGITGNGGPAQETRDSTPAME